MRPSSISILFLSFLFGNMASPLFAQDQGMYRTVDGQVQVNGKGGDVGISATSNELFVRLDHETGELFIRLDQSSLQTGDDSLDRLIDSLAGPPIIFEGSLKRGGFDPRHCYSPTPLKIQGSLKYKGMEKDLTATGSFESRFSNDRIPCMLEIAMEIELEEADEPGFLPGFEENVRIHILQAILNPNK